MISSDGSMVAFESYASNLDATVTDTNSTQTSLLAIGRLLAQQPD